MDYDPQKSDVFYCIDVATTLSPINSDVSYIPNGNLSACYLHEMMKHPVSIDSDSYPDIHIPYWNIQDVPPRSSWYKNGNVKLPREISAVGTTANSDGSDDGINDLLIGEMNANLTLETPDDWDDDSLGMNQSMGGLHDLLLLLNTNNSELVSISNEVDRDDEDGQVDSTESNFLSQYVGSSSNLKFVYPQFLTAGFFGNAHTHKVLIGVQWVVHSMELFDEISVYSLKTPNKTIAGGQVYQALSRAFAKKQTRSLF